jgi:hypothetical protein
MSNSVDGIKFNHNDQELSELFQLLSKNDGTLKVDEHKISEENIEKRIKLLNTILIYQNELNKKSRFSTINKSYSFLYYLLNKLSNQELKDIITKSQKNERNKKLLEGIESKAKELIESIDEKEKAKISEKLSEERLKQIKTDIDRYTKYILEPINSMYINNKEKLSSDTDYNERDEDKKLADDDAKNYIVLKKEERLQSFRGATTKYIYYILYKKSNKKSNIYTMKTELWNHNNYQPIEPIKLLIYDIDFPSQYLYLLSELYNELKELKELNFSPGGKLTTTPVYKLNGEKVSFLINKKKVNRSIYVKGNGNRKAKYCKINNEFVLLSKLKNKIIEI